MIEHLIIAGGAIKGLPTYGMLRKSQQLGLWDFKNIKSIYGTSIGSYIAVIICLMTIHSITNETGEEEIYDAPLYNWETMDDFIIKRPWDTLFKLDFHTILKGLDERGFMQSSVSKDAFAPILKGLCLSVDITMKELYDKTGIDLHIITCDLNTTATIDISHKTYPDWRIVDATYASSSLPVLFAPIIENGKCYIDGGFLCNYPLMNCINDYQLESEEELSTIMGFRVNLDETEQVINENSNIFNIGQIFYLKLFEKWFQQINDTITKIPNEFVIYKMENNVDTVSKTVTSSEERKKFIEYGENLILQYLEERGQI